MKTFTINIFVIKKNWEVIQADGIQDWYNLVQAYSVPKEDREKFEVYEETEAYHFKDKTFWPYTTEIITKEIEL